MSNFLHINHNQDKSCCVFKLICPNKIKKSRNWIAWAHKVECWLINLCTTEIYTWLVCYSSLYVSQIQRGKEELKFLPWSPGGPCSPFCPAVHLAAQLHKEGRSLYFLHHLKCQHSLGSCALEHLLHEQEMPDFSVYQTCRLTDNCKAYLLIYNCSMRKQLKSFKTLMWSHTYSGIERHAALVTHSYGLDGEFCLMWFGCEHHQT